MIVAADLYATDLMHLEINSFFASAFVTELDQKLHFFAERRHLDAISRSVPVERGISFRSWQKISRFPSVRVPIREILTVFRTIRVAIYTRRHRPILLHIFCASHLSHVILRLVFRLIPPNCPILLTFHGELESLARMERRPWSPAFWLPLSLKIRVRGLIPVVLGESVRRQAAQRNCSTLGWIVIEHPYDFSAPTKSPSLEPRLLVIGCIGGANIQKGTHLLFGLAESFRDEVARCRIQFRIIGKIDPALRPLANELVQLPRHGEFVIREEYDRAISELDAVLFFFPADTYQLTASGSLFDAIRHNKPIIALQNPYFSYIQSLVPGDAFTLVQSLEEMRMTLRKWQETGPPQQVRAAYDRVRQLHDRSRVVEQFLRQLREKLPVLDHAGLAEGSNSGDAK